MGLTDGVFARPASDSRSLFGELLDWVLAPLLFLWPMSLALTSIVAQEIAHKPYDAELSRIVQALAASAKVGLAAGNGTEPVFAFTLQRAAATLLHGDDETNRRFQVLGHRGELLAGEAALRVPSLDAKADGQVHFRDDKLRDEPVRVAYLWLGGGQASDGEALVQVAETLDQRRRLATDMIRDVLLPQFLILPVAALLMWFAISRGIRPLNELQARIRRRDANDLSPIPEHEVPDEVAPLVSSINDLLQRLDRSLAVQRQFLADAAHQLKTPLAGLRTQAELAAREIDSGRGDPESIKHSLRQIGISTQRAAHMVNQLLSMARAESAGQPLRQQWVDLGALTRAVVRDFVPRALERRIDLGYEGPQAEGGVGAQTARMEAEPVLLGELVRNLVDNALLYTPAGGTVTVRVLNDPVAQAAVLQVEDDGPGIPAAERELVFQAFYRRLGTQTDGSGLGLAIAAEIAQRHRARITVADARADAGATAGAPGALFTVRFARSA